MELREQPVAWVLSAVGPGDQIQVEGTAAAVPLSLVIYFLMFTFTREVQVAPFNEAFPLSAEG